MHKFIQLSLVSLELRVFLPQDNTHVFPLRHIADFKFNHIIPILLQYTDEFTKAREIWPLVEKSYKKL